MAQINGCSVRELKVTLAQVIANLIYKADLPTLQNLCSPLIKMIPTCFIKSTLLFHLSYVAWFMQIIVGLLVRMWKIVIIVLNDNFHAG